MGEVSFEQLVGIWRLFLDSVLAGTIMGAVLGFLGVYIILRRMVFLSAALGQSAGLGVTLAFYAQLHLGLTWLSPTLGAGAATLLAASALMSGRDEGRRDGLLGMIFLLGGAGALIVSGHIVQELQDIQTLLFGTAVAVLPEDFRTLAQVAGAVTLVHLVAWRGFAAVSFDPDGARARRLPTRVLDWTLMVTLALTISVCTRVLGALPAFAFSVLPAMVAVRLTASIPRALWMAGALGALCGFGGYTLAVLRDLPVGASQTLVGVVMVALAMAVAPLVRRWRTRQAAALAPHAH